MTLDNEMHKGIDKLTCQLRIHLIECERKKMCNTNEQNFSHEWNFLKKFLVGIST